MSSSSVLGCEGAMVIIGAEGATLTSSSGFSVSYAAGVSDGREAISRSAEDCPSRQDREAGVPNKVVARSFRSRQRPSSL